MKIINQILFVLVLVTVSRITLTAQELISAVTNSGNSQRHILTEVDGLSYILRMDTQDSIRVYQMKDGEAILLHSTHYHSVIDEYRYKYLREFLFLEHPDGSIAYDFVNNKEYFFPFDEGLSYTSWGTYYSKSDQVMLTQSSADFTSQNRMIFDFKSKSVNDFDEAYSIRGIYNSYYLLYQKINSDSSLISIYDRALDSVTAEMTVHRLQYSHHESGIVYMLSDGVYTYDIPLETTQKVYDLEASDLSSIRFDQSEGHLSVSYNNGESEQSILINKSSHAVFESMDYIDHLLYDEGSGKLIYESSNDLFIFDLSTNIATEIQSNSHVDDIVILEDQYLLHFSYSSNKLYDLVIAEETSVGGDRFSSYRVTPMTISVEGGVFINFDTSIEFLDELLYYSRDSRSVEPAFPIPFVGSGLLERSELLLSSEDVIIVNDENIYAVIEDGLIELTTSTLIESNYEPYQKSVEGIIWAESGGGSFDFYTYKDGVKTQAASVNKSELGSPFGNKTIRNFIVTFEGVYFTVLLGFEEFLYKVDRIDNNLSKISDTAGFTSKIFGVFNGELYYLSNGIKVVRMNGEIEDIAIPTNNLSVFTSHLILNDKFFVTGTNGIYEIKEDTVINVVPFENEIFVFFQHIGDLIYINLSNSETYILLDGEWRLNESFPTENFSAFDKDHLRVTKTIGTNLHVSTLYNLQNEQYIDLPEEIRLFKFTTSFYNFNKKFVIAAEGFFPNYVHIYEVSENFDQFDEVTSFISSGKGLRSNWKSFDNEGLLYSGSRIFLMNEELDFVPMEGISGDPQIVDIVEKDGFFYFIAYHPTLGRQVFRTQVFSQRVGTSESVISTLRLSPNPATDYINLGDEKFTSTARYQIYNITGNLNRSGYLINGQVDIKHLLQGSYILVVIDRDQQFSSKFVKI